MTAHCVCNIGTQMNRSPLRLKFEHNNNIQDDRTIMVQEYQINNSYIRHYQ